MPVSIFRWTCHGAEAGREATASIADCTPDVVYSVGVNPATSASDMASGGGSDSTRTGTSMPASRSTLPSSTRATASQVAPPASAARATSTEPWP